MAADASRAVELPFVLIAFCCVRYSRSWNGTPSMVYIIFDERVSNKSTLTVSRYFILFYLHMMELAMRTLLPSPLGH